jgi:diguanylate cyclase (GGDEF)-like protein
MREALRHLARLLSESASVSDFVARFAGDEYVVLTCDRAQMSSLITILKDKLSANLLRLEDGNELSITVSIGASHYPEDGANADELYKRADERMYRMKKDAMPNT